MAWFSRERSGAEGAGEGEKRVRTEGLWLKCEGCSQIIWKKTLEENGQVCPQCDHHFRVDARARLALLFDGGAYEEVDASLTSTDPLRFSDSKTYAVRLAEMQKATSMSDALLAGWGKVEGRPVNICAMELKFVGGSMGTVVGEKITRAVERSMERRAPLIVISASGGARMQEGAISLMQMAKISSALMRLDEAGVPFISLMTDPTTGGVTASLAMLGDLNIAEPRALIGFAGPRVIEQTIRQTLPEGFQRSEFLLEKGMLDLIVDRREMKAVIANALTKLLRQPPIKLDAEPVSTTY